MEPIGREVLIFELDGRRYGLPAAEVRELLRAVAIVPLPMAGPAVEGVVNLRGHVIPAIDLRARLGLPIRSVARGGPDHFRVVRVAERHEAMDRALRNRFAPLDPFLLRLRRRNNVVRATRAAGTCDG